MIRRRKRKGSPKGKIYFFETLLVLSKTLYDMLGTWAWRIFGFLSLGLTAGAEWLSDTNNQNAIKAAVPIWIFFTIIIFAGAIKAYPKAKDVRDSDNTNREKV